MNAYVKDLVRICEESGFNNKVVSKKQQRFKLFRVLNEILFFIWYSVSFSFGSDCLIVFVSQEFIVPVFGKQTLIICHDLIQLKHPRSKLVKLKLIFNLFIIKFLKYRVVVPSRATQRKLKKIFNINSDIIENIIEVNCNKCERKHSNVESNILWIGTAMKHKSIETVLELSLSFPELNFTVIVPKALHINMAIYKNIRMVSNLTEQELNIEYARAGLFLSTSFDEGFNRPIHEAICFSLPVVARNLAVYHDIKGDLTLFRSNVHLHQIISGFSFNNRFCCAENINYSNFQYVNKKYRLLLRCMGFNLAQELESR